MDKPDTVQVNISVTLILCIIGASLVSIVLILVKSSHEKNNGTAYLFCVKIEKDRLKTLYMISVKVIKLSHGATKV